MPQYLNIFFEILFDLGFVNTSKTDSFFGLPGGLVCNGVIDCAVHGEDELFCPQRYTCETGE